MLDADFFDRDTLLVARELVGKVLCRKLQGVWLKARLVETEAYMAREKASHGSLGLTPSRKALWAPPGTIYMYWSRAGDSMNTSTRGAGNGVLLKGAVPVFDEGELGRAQRALMHGLNPRRGGGRRPEHRLCAGQTLLCRSLGLTIAEWGGRPFDREALYLQDDGYRPAPLLAAPRLGIHPERDAHLPWRFLDGGNLRSVTKNPLSARGAREGVDWWVIDPQSGEVRR